MYHYVEDKNILKGAQSACSILMSELEEELREKGINSQFFLVGSGARNMVRQNEKEPIDFDYNLTIISCNDFNNCKLIKEQIRKTFNAVLKRNGLKDCDDSTSALTTKRLCLRDNKSIEFSIDVCIVTQANNGNWLRLKHEKASDTHSDKYYWNEAPNSDEYREKAKAIKSIPRGWEELRKHYLDLKNNDLRKNDQNHPSFVCYIQAVNDVYNEMRQKELC